VSRSQRAPLVALLFALGCAHQSWQDPGHRWITGSTPHFKIHGDGSRGSVEDVLVRLEETYAALTATFFPNTEVPIIEGMVFSQEEEFKTLTAGRPVVGMFVLQVGSNGSLLVVRGDAPAYLIDQTVTHELVHRLILQHYPALPLFVNEGLALYLETVQVRQKGIIFGAAPRDELDVANYGGAVPLPELLAAPGTSMHGPDGHRYYASAWAFMHELIQGGGGRYLRRLPAALRAFEQVERSPRGFAEALAAVYPERTLPELEQSMFHEAAWAEGMGADHVVGVTFPHPTVNPITADADPTYIKELSSQLMSRLNPGYMR
jgi:hypothetical protein